MAGLIAGWPGIVAAALVAAQTGTGFHAASVKSNTSGSRQSSMLEDQLGLKLEPGRGPIEVFIIDAVDRPSPD